MRARNPRRLRFTIVAIAAALLPVVAADAGDDRSSLARRVERQAAELARARIEPPDRFEVLAARFAGADPLDEVPDRLEAARIDGPNVSGIVRVSFRMLVGGVARGEARATVRGRVLGPALAAAHTLPRDRIVAAPDLALLEGDLTRLRRPPLRRPDQAIGQVPVRTLGAGRVLTAELLRPAPAVRRGERVDLLVAGERLSIRVRARALRDGRPGERVPAENETTGAVVVGVVQADGSLRVVP